MLPDCHLFHWGSNIHTNKHCRLYLYFKNHFLKYLLFFLMLIFRERYNHLNAQEKNPRIQDFRALARS